MSSMLKLSLALATLVILGCTKEEAQEKPGGDGLRGYWVLTYLENVTGTYSSVWTFWEDSTYEWNLRIEDSDIDQEGDGNYVLVGDTLTLDGIVPEYVGRDTLFLSFSDGSFTFLDADDKSWTYSRLRGEGSYDCGRGSIGLSWSSTTSTDAFYVEGAMEGFGPGRSGVCAYLWTEGNKGRAAFFGSVFSDSCSWDEVEIQLFSETETIQPGYYAPESGSYVHYFLNFHPVVREDELIWVPDWEFGLSGHITLTINGNHIVGYFEGTGVSPTTWETVEITNGVFDVYAVEGPPPQ